MQRELLLRQGYKLVGKAGGVKLCHWTKESLRGDRYCYKQKFYGIESHRCIQMTPSVFHCNLKCLFCWRYNNYPYVEMKEWDDPSYLLEKSIEAQRALISGFGGNPKVNKEKFEEAMEPKHIAISLAGEPTLYPELGEFIEEAHRKGFTTFLVTNGTNPKALEELDPLPTQLYVSVTAPNERVFEALNLPRVPRAWESLIETLRLLPSLGTRRVIRHTLVKGWNMPFVEDYVKLDSIAEPDFIEPKAYMNLGYSRYRLNPGNMPKHWEILKFSEELSKELGYHIVSESKESRVVLISKRKSGIRIAQ